jgi:hypothetical protein
MNGTVRIKVVGISVRWSMAAGAVGGFVPGLFVGCLLGAGVSWAAGAVLDWQRQLGFTLGVTQQLRPFGDQVPVLEQLADSWALVIPAIGIANGLLWALVGALAAAVVVTLLGRARLGVPVEIELEEGLLSRER